MDASPSTHPFACPHCGGANQVAAARLGGVVACAACAKPFRAEIPAGTPLASAPGGIPFDVPAPAAAKPAPPAAGFARDFSPLRLHPAPWRSRFAATCFDSVLVLGGLVSLGYSTVVRQEPVWMWFFLAGGAALALAGGFNLLVPWIASRGETLEITASATRWSKGWFKRRSVEIRHDGIRAVEVEQTFGQRLLGIGTLTLASDGNDEDEIVMKGVPDVKAVAGKLRELQRK